MSKILTWPISKNMVGTEVVLKSTTGKHHWWKFEVGKTYVIGKSRSVHGRYGPKDGSGHTLPENYGGAWVFEIIPTKWYQRVLNWFKGE